MFAYTSHAMNLATFLDRHRANKGGTGAPVRRGKITHTSMGEVKGSYSIPDEDMEQFLQLYFLRQLYQLYSIQLYFRGSYYPMTL